MAADSWMWADTKFSLSFLVFKAISFQMSDSLLFKQILMKKFLPLHILIAKVFLPSLFFLFPSVSSFPGTQSDASIYFSPIDLWNATLRNISRFIDP